MSVKLDLFTAVLPLSGPKAAGLECVIDATDFNWLSQWKWHVHSRGYIVRNDPGPPRRTIFLGREILGLERGDPMQADHINLDKLDNRRANLRPLTHAQQQQNRSAAGRGVSRYRGVHRNYGRWVACATISGRVVRIGYFDDEDEAGRVAAAFRAEHMPYSFEAYNARAAA